jgi:hypothetical protein
MKTFSQSPPSLKAVMMKTGQCLMGVTAFDLTETGPNSQVIVIRDPAWLITAGEITNQQTKNTLMETYRFKPFFSETKTEEAVVVIDMVLSVMVPDKWMTQDYNDYIEERKELLRVYNAKRSKVQSDEDAEAVNAFLYELHNIPIPENTMTNEDHKDHEAT